jgi:hypothetical protein
MRFPIPSDFTRSNALSASSRPGVRDAFCWGRFPLARPLPSIPSAAGCPALFGDFAGTAGLSDLQVRSSSAYELACYRQLFLSALPGLFVHVGNSSATETFRAATYWNEPLGERVGRRLGSSPEQVI